MLHRGVVFIQEKDEHQKWTCGFLTKNMIDSFNALYCANL